MQRIILLSFLILVSFSSCKSLKEVQKETEMFQPKLDSTTKVVYKDLKIQPYDKLRIQLNTEATILQDQTAIFNLPGNVGSVASSNAGANSSYQVDKSGFIEYPKLGKLQVVGLTSVQLKDSLTKLLSGYVKNPRVFVQIIEVPIYAFGQIGRTGKVIFNEERINLYDFLSVTGGNIPQGGRLDNILVVREDSGSRKYYNVDISTPTTLYQSPVFQLQQNDIVYVQPTKNKLRQLRNNEFSTSLQLGTTGINLFTSFISIVLLLVSISR